MGNEEMFNKNTNYVADDISATQPVPTTETETQYENLYSDSQTTQSSAQESAQSEVQSQPIQNTQQAAPVQPRPAAQPYQQPYYVQNSQAVNQYQQFPQHYDSNGNPVNYGVYTPKKKKSNTGAKVALGIGAMMMVAVLGIGGGFVGTKLAGMNAVPAVESSVGSKNTDDNNGDKDDSVLNITQASDSDLKPTSVQEVAAKVKDSVVEITTETTGYDSFYGQYVSTAAGSGVIITEDGYILTNNHVIEDANNITIRMTDGKTYEAKVIGKDSTLDVALIKIDATGLPTSTFGKSSTLNVGQLAVVIGNPLGKLGGTVTDGIISALDREIKIDGKTMTLLQTSAAINPGNSGGGLYDGEGNLVGIVVAKSVYTSSGTAVEGIGYAIPIDNILDVLSDLKSKGYVTGRGYLGVSLSEITSQSDLFMYGIDRAGVYVTAVYEGTAAEKAGLKIRDCITKIDDTEITSKSTLNSYIMKHKAGDQVKLTVYRNGKEMEITVTLDERPSDDTPVKESKQNGSGNNSDYGNGNFGNFGFGNSYGFDGDDEYAG